MSIIPKSHPRVKSLLIREKLVKGFEEGLVAKEGLLAHGRGETFDYLLGEKTNKPAKNAIKVASALMLIADNPVISVNGNIAALCPKEIIRLAKIFGAKIEVNLFYANKKRKKNIVDILRKHGAKNVLGVKPSSSVVLPGLESARRVVDKDGIYSADVVLVPLEDGDRTMALRKAGKKVITIDLNPLSRTSQTANITIVDNVTRSMKILIETASSISKVNPSQLQKIVSEFDNKKNLNDSVMEIKNHLSRRARLA